MTVDILYNMIWNMLHTVSGNKITKKRWQMQKVLVVEDDWELNQGICYALQGEEVPYRGAHSLEEAKKPV